MPLVVTHILKATGIAGTENHLLALLPALDRRRFRVHAIVLEDARFPVDSFVVRLIEQGIPTRRLRMRGDADPTVVPRLWRILRQEQPTIVHTHLIHADLHGGLAARLARTPWVVSSRHNDDPFRRRGAAAQLVHVNNRLFHHFIAISEHMRDFCVKVEGIATDAVTTIPYGLNPVAPPAPPDLHAEFGFGPGPIVVTVARLIPQKGLRHLITAFAHAREVVPDANLLIVGDGTMRAALQARARVLVPGACVRFAGWRSDAAQILFGADVFVLPSLWEGFGLVLLEAMAARLPVIASAVGAIPEIVIEGETGRLVPPGDEIALADALSALLASADQRTRMGTGGRARLESRFTVAQMVHATETVYERLVRVRDTERTLRQIQ